MKAKEQVQNFLDTTKNFGKRFYNAIYDEEDYTIRVTALAVSRDLTYILRWIIGCIPERRQDEDKIDEILPKDILSGKVPRYGWELRLREENKTWFPKFDKEIFFDVFYLNGFVHADVLKKDGVSIIKWNN